VVLLGHDPSPAPPAGHNMKRLSETVFSYPKRALVKDETGMGFGKSVKSLGLNSGEVIKAYAEETCGKHANQP
ncbi:hypothetical protein, partial [Deinococcus aerophilus]|uniref:hypothetical protein n=1 Tax=Deinococcus aerophilus TaxID=522488 RepID=UPI001E30D141